MGRKQQRKRRRKTYRDHCHFRDCTTLQGIRDNTEERLNVLGPVYDLLTYDNKVLTACLYVVQQRANEAETIKELVIALKEEIKIANDKRHKDIAKQLTLFAGQIARAQLKKAKSEANAAASHAQE